MALTQRTHDAPSEQPFHMGDRIRKAREHIGQDRQTFAETIGIHRDTLAKYEESGKAKRATLISIAWNTPVRLEWLETGELPWLNTQEGPHPGKGEGQGLPRLDSNQQPIGYKPGLLTHVDFRARKVAAS